MIQFYAPDIKESPYLGPEETLHCIRVLRKKPGDTVYLTDGKGTRFEARIEGTEGKRAKVEILSEERIEKNWKNKITLVVAPTKNADRMAWLVEKATEIGVDEIRFVSCRYSERKSVNVERLRRNAISAMNQSLKTHLPEIFEIAPLSGVSELKGDKFVGYCSADTERAELVRALRAGSDTVIAIGPEGDFSKEEIDLLIKSGYKPVTFGDERLRTETAALYGVAAVHIVNNIQQNKI